MYNVHPVNLAAYAGKNEMRTDGEQYMTATH